MPVACVWGPCPVSPPADPSLPTLQGSPLPPTFDLQLKRGSRSWPSALEHLWGQPDEEGRRRPGVRDGRARRPLLLWLFLCGSPSGCKVSATSVSLISQQREDQTRLLRFGWKPPGRGVAPSPSTWARGPWPGTARQPSVVLGRGWAGPSWGPQAGQRAPRPQASRGTRHISTRANTRLPSDTGQPET